MSTQDLAVVTSLTKAQIINILKIKHLRDEIKKGTAKPDSKHYAALADADYKTGVPFTDKKDSNYSNAIQLLTNKVKDMAVKELKIHVTDHKFSTEFEKIKPKPVYEGHDWPTDSYLAQMAIMKLCKSGLLSDKKHKPIMDLLDQFFTGEAATIKEERIEKAKKTREAKKLEGDEEKIKKLEKEIKNKTEKIESIKNPKKKKATKAKASTSATTSTITKEESEAEPSEEEEVEDSEDAGSEAESDE